MSLFIPTIPQPGDNLDFSQGQLLSNNSGLDTVFGVDHYKFSDATVNKGFHNQVTTPVRSHPVTGPNPVFYGAQDSANLGVLQYSSGPNNAVPTPLTMLQSPSTPISLAPNGTTNIIDFTGLTRAFGVISASDTTGTNVGSMWYIVWTGAVIYKTAIISGTFQAINSGNILQLKNISPSITYNNIYWTFQLLRTS